MKHLIFLAAFVLLTTTLTTLTTGCYYDNEQDLYGVTSCDTLNKRYSVEITKILAANCNECHLPSSGSYVDIAIDNYDAVTGYVQDGKLLKRINDSSNPMPPAGLMSECDRAAIQAWINAGALNN